VRAWPAGLRTCSSGLLGGRCLSMADHVAVTRTRGGATAAAGPFMLLVHVAFVCSRLAVSSRDATAPSGVELRFVQSWPATVGPISRGSVSPVFALVKGESAVSPPAQEGIRGAEAPAGGLGNQHRACAESRRTARRTRRSWSWRRRVSGRTLRRNRSSGRPTGPPAASSCAVGAAQATLHSASHDHEASRLDGVT
jgi:hypothetical protein